MKTLRKCITLFVLITCGLYFIYALLQINPAIIKQRIITDDVTHLQAPRRGCNSSSRRYVISLSYWEQLVMAARNMFQLVVVANDWGSRVVEPYTINSRLFGLRNFVIKKDLALSHNTEPLSLSQLVDINQLNTIICNHGLPHLVSLQQFIESSAESVIIVHFIHYIDNPNDINVPANIKGRIIAQFNSSPVVDCGTLLEQYKQKIVTLLHQETDGSRDHVIKRYYCVDATKLISTVKLGEMIGISELDEFTIVVVDWHGYSKRSMVYNSANGPHINKRATLNTSYNGPSFAGVTLPHSQRVIKAANSYLQHITKPFIAVHIRSEKVGQVQATHKGYLASCMNKMLDLLQQLKQLHNISNVIICIDAGETGSDSCVNCRSGSKTLQILYDHHLNVTHFDPTTINETQDKGFIALVEMNMLSHGEHLIVVGGGSFQNQTLQNFKHYHDSIANGNFYELCTKRH